jgi:anion-transporting  ArsA/GET3 family ATPase
MMLDMKRTFDEVVLAHASPEKAEQILANPFYVALSSSFAGTQEYMAMEKLGQLHKQAERTGDWDLIIVDTPPSRSALDFLDAPERLASLLEGRFLRLLLAPARGPLRLMSAGVNLAMSVMNKVLGAQVLTDVQTFAAAFDTLFGGFRERAEKTVALLREPHTAFLVVAAPQNDALREASYFTERLREEKMPLAGVVLNRVTTTHVPDLSAEQALAAAERLESPDRGGGAGKANNSKSDLTAAVLRLHADRMHQVVSDRKRADRFRRGHRSIATVDVPALPDDVHDLTGLRAIGELLTA